MRSLVQLDDLRNELEAADEREKLMRQQLREAENALISAKADAQRLKASTNGHDQRKAELESALAQVRSPVTCSLDTSCIAQHYHYSRLYRMGVRIG